MKARVLLLLLPFLPAAAPASARTSRDIPPQPVVHAPILLEAATIPPFNVRVEARMDLLMDSFDVQRGTETFDALFTGAQLRLDYRYSPGGRMEVFFRALYMAQNHEESVSGGRRVFQKSSSGAGQPVFGVKLPFAGGGALMLHTAPPTAASRDPRLGEGTRYGADVLFHVGPHWHLGVGHAVRLPYDLGASSSATLRRDPGDVTTLALARTNRDNPRFDKGDFVSPVFELHGVLRGPGALGQGTAPGLFFSLSGRAVAGFVLGKVNSRATHLTKAALAIGFGDTVRKTQDPVFGVGDLQLIVGYELLWGRSPPP